MSKQEQYSLAIGLPSPTLPTPPHAETQTRASKKFKFKNPYKLQTPLPDMSAVPRSQTLSPASTTDSEWSGMNSYAQAPPRSDSPYSPSLPFNRGDLVTPPHSGNGGPMNSINGGYPPEPPSLSMGLDGRRPSDAADLRPSPPASIAASRSSDGTLSDQQSNKYKRMERELQQHYSILRAYLRGGAPQPPRPNKARDKLLRLSPSQFHELSTDVYDELQRRQAFGPPGRPSPRHVPPFLQPRNEFHEKRNQAREKLSSLQDPRFRDLSTDVFCELERRFPHFQRMDRGGRNSPAPRSQSRGPPSRGSNTSGYGLPGGPRSASRGPPPGPGRGYGPGGQVFPPRNGSISGIGVPRFDNPPLPQDSDYRRPTPQQFQSSTIMPNKSTMVEDEDEYGNGNDDRRSDAFGLDGILPSNRDTSNTSRSAGSSNREAKLLEAAQTQVGELQERVDELEIGIRTKDQELRRLEEETKSSMSSEWVDVKQDLEKKLEDAEMLNQTIKNELDRLHTDQASVERDLRSQLERAKSTKSGDRSLKAKHDKMEQDYRDLQIKLSEQRKVTDEVKQQAGGFLAEMRAMADGGGGSLEREEKLQTDVRRLEQEVIEWKGRYVRTKTQLRSMRASSLGLSIQRVDATKLAKDDSFTRPDGLIKDVHVTKFQIAIDELLHVARAGEPSAVLDYMKAVVVAVRCITQDIMVASPTGKDDETAQRRAKLRSKVSATANNVITASKNFASSNGISPVSLLDAAASHLTAAIVELVRTVKIRPTPAGELEDDEDGNIDQTSSPSYFSVEHSLRRTSGNDSIYSAVSTPPSRDMELRKHKRSISRQVHGLPNGTNGVKPGPALRRGAGELEELKNYLEDQTDALIQSIQSLVDSIRAEESMPAIRTNIDAITGVVESVVEATESLYPTSATLKAVAEASVRSLANCKARLQSASSSSRSLDQNPSSSVVRAFTQRLPPLAFETAREAKDVVLKVEGIDTTADHFS